MNSEKILCLAALLLASVSLISPADAASTAMPSYPRVMPIGNCQVAPPPDSSALSTTDPQLIQAWVSGTSKQAIIDYFNKQCGKSYGEFSVVALLEITGPPLKIWGWCTGNKPSSCQNGGVSGSGVPSGATSGSGGGGGGMKGMSGGAVLKPGSLPPGF